MGLIRCVVAASLAAWLGACSFGDPDTDGRLAASHGGTCGDHAGTILDSSGVEIGTVAVTNTSDTLIIDIDGSGSAIKKYYLYAGTGPIPTNSNGYVSAESFPFKESLSTPYPGSYQITLDYASIGIVPDLCPLLNVALYTQIGNKFGWADGPITFPEGPNKTGTALIYQCCDAGPPPPPPPPPGDTPIDDELGPLYTGDDPPQKDVVPGAIEPERIAAIRGQVTDLSGAPLEGVRVTIHNQPDYGYTLTDAAGDFTLVVSGGGHFGVDFELADHLPVQRRIELPWHDIAWVEPVALVSAAGSPTTLVAAEASVWQVAEGQEATDDDGTRQAVAMIPPGTGMTVEGPGGSQSLLLGTVRITEYTVGDNGPAAMPGALPPATAYTYAANFEITEAEPGDTVRFNQPIAVYVDNFLGFPVGEEMPSGYYDLDLGHWVPAPNGLIVEIVSITAGLADLDIDGDGVADDASSIGVTDGERAELASRYTAGTSLWRMPIEHFTPYDFNVTRLLPGDARNPDNNPHAAGLGDRPCEQAGSIIECENQVLAEAISIAGMGLALHYSSAQAPGRSENRTIEIPVSGAEVPASCQAIHLRIAIAGQQHAEAFPCTPNQSFTFTWDGKNAWGQPVHGQRRAVIHVGFQYENVVYGRSGGEFGLPDPSAIPLPSFGGTVTIDRASGSLVLWTKAARYIGVLESNPATSIGGWTLTPHHRRDRAGHRLYHGDGTRRTATGDAIGVQQLVDTPIPAITSNGTDGLAVTADGTIYYSSQRKVYRRHPSGVIEHFAGLDYVNPHCPVEVDDPLQARFGGGGSAGIKDIAVGPDGSLYIAEDLRIQRIYPDGRVRLVASTDACGPVPAGVVEITAGAAGRVAVGQNGDVYYGSPNIWSGDNARVWRISAGRTLTSTWVGPVNDLAIDLEDRLIFADGTRIRRLSPSGQIETLLGVGSGGEGDPALTAQSRPLSLVQAPDGSIAFYHHHVTSQGTVRLIRRIKDGILERVAGTIPSTGFDASATDPFETSFARVQQIAIHPDGSLITLEVASSGSYTIRRIGSFAGLGEIIVERGGETFEAVPSEHGAVLYLYDSANRHRETIDSTTAETISLFGYDAEDRLASVTDAHGNVVTINRDAEGQATSIAAPFGQVTTLSYDVDGYLSQVKNPENEMVSMTYGDGGLLSELVDPLGRLHQYAYDARGRLISDDMPVGIKTLDRTLTEIAAGYEEQVTVTTELGRAVSYLNRPVPASACPLTNAGPCTERIVTDSAGVEVASYDFLNGSRVVELADGSRFTIEQERDPRFGHITSHVSAATVAVAGGPTVSVTYDHGATLADPADPLSVTELTRSVTLNGDTWSWIYDVVNRQISSTTPEGRTYSAGLDEEGRIDVETVPGISPIDYDYDTLGRLERVTQGERELTYTYDPSTGFLASESRLEEVNGGIGEYQTVSFVHDAVGRVREIFLPDPDQRIIALSYDPTGNLSSVTPPDRLPHLFEYTPDDRLSLYNPPDVPGVGTDETLHEYNADGQLFRTTRADGEVVTLTYDPTTGRLDSVTSSAGTSTLTYHPTTGLLATLSAPDGGTQALTYAGGTLVGIEWLGGLVEGEVQATLDSSYRFDSITVVGSPTVSYTYDADGLLASAGDMTFTRSPSSGLVTGASIDGLAETWTTNSFGEPETHTATFGTTTIYEVASTYDRLGRVDTRVETIDGTTITLEYFYDLGGRLKEVLEDGVTVEAYTYDDNDNRTSEDGASGTVTGTYDGQDRLETYGAATYAYDDAGDLVSSSQPGGTTTYDYDGFGNLRTVVLPDGTTIEYVIDGTGRRIGKRVGGLLLQGFLYKDDLNPVAELDGAGQIVSLFVYGNHPNVPDYMVRDGVTYRIVSDHVGSPRLVVDVLTGQVVGRIDYNAFGRITAETNPGLLPFGFAGGIHDRDTGLVRLGARDYDSHTGRFTTKDPVLFDGGATNLYAYAENDPINRIDPTGNSSLLGCFNSPGNAAACAYVIGEATAIRGIAGSLGGAGASAGAGAGACSISIAELGALGGVGLAGLSINSAPGIPVPRASDTPFPRVQPIPFARPTPNRSRCLDAAAAGGAVWEEFCRSIRSSRKRSLCWGNSQDSETRKRGFCFNNF